MPAGVQFLRANHPGNSEIFTCPRGMSSEKYRLRINSNSLYEGFCSVPQMQIINDDFDVWNKVTRKTTYSFRSWWRDRRGHGPWGCNQEDIHLIPTSWRQSFSNNPQWLPQQSFQPILQGYPQNVLEKATLRKILSWKRLETIHQHGSWNSYQEKYILKGQSDIHN